MFLSLESGSLAELKKCQGREAEGGNLEESQGEGIPGRDGKAAPENSEKKEKKGERAMEGAWVASGVFKMTEAKYTFVP